jgi:hypothetical protein
VTDVREVTISELDETHPMVRQFVVNAGLQLDPLPRRCVACNERNVGEAEACANCGAPILPHAIGDDERD